MASKNEKDRVKQIQDKCQTILTQLLKDEDNKYCVDCDAKGPRWASWNLGIFLCIRCAGIHRNLGVHISKVKSVNLDSWTPEQVVSLQQMGNSRARAVYEANLPDSFRRPQTDSALEAFVRAKYEHRKYVAREWVPPSPPTVNWDKEIDEEMERQKKKKRSTSSTAASLTAAPLSGTDKKSTKSSEVVPQLLPKPKSSASPKPGRATPKRDSGNTTDLLGTDSKTNSTDAAASSKENSDDVFSSFLSAPQRPPAAQQVKATESKVVDLKSEEESFFNQPAPSEKEKSKMTKDSILALYGQGPNTAPNGVFSQQVCGGFSQNQPFSQFPQQQPQSGGFQGFATQGFQNAFPQNGNANNSIQFNSAPPFGQLASNPSSIPPQSSQFAQFNQQPAFSMPNNAFQGGNMSAFAANANQFNSQPAPFQNSNLNGGFSSGVTQSFFGAPTSNTLPQQFGGMSLGHQAGQPGLFAPAQTASLPGAFPVKSQQPNMAANSVWQ